MYTLSCRVSDSRLEQVRAAVEPFRATCPREAPARHERKPDAELRNG